MTAVGVMTVGVAVLNAEAWTGNLHHIVSKAWVEENTDVAAIVVTRGGFAVVWINLVHVHLAETRLVWHWARYAALRRPPMDVLSVHDLALAVSMLADDRFV